MPQVSYEGDAVVRVYVALDLERFNVLGWD